MTVPYEGPERRSDALSLAEEVREYRDAVQGLAERVTSLTDNTQQLNHVAEAQARQERVGQQALSEATRALTIARHTDEHAAPLRAVQAKWESDAAALLTLQERIAKRGNRQGLMWFLASLVIIVIAGTVTAAGVLNNRNSRLDECRQRVANSRTAVEAYDKLLNSQTISADPTLTEFLKTARAVSVRGSQVKC